MKTITYSAIPIDAGQVHGWKDIPINGAADPDPLVPLGPLSSEANMAITSSIYFGEHSNSPYAEDKNRLQGSLLTLFARRSVVRRLLAAEQLLPPGHHLLVFDAYRTSQVQKSLYDSYKRKLKEKWPGMDNEALDAETQKYVSIPSTDPTKPSPHNTGGAVDVVIVKLDRAGERELQNLRSQLAARTISFAKRVGLEIQLSAIIRHHGTMLDFGTPFDHGSEKSALTYYEAKIAAGEDLTANEMRACNNRRLLFKVMLQAGFQPYSAEWWHFNAPESQMGAATSGQKVATFGAITLDEGSIQHEKTRLHVHQESLRLHAEGCQGKVQDAFQAEILAAIQGSGDIRLAAKWPAEIIAP